MKKYSGHYLNQQKIQAKDSIENLTRYMRRYRKYKEAHIAFCIGEVQPSGVYCRLQN